MTPETMGELANCRDHRRRHDATGKFERVSLQRITCGTGFHPAFGQ